MLTSSLEIWTCSFFSSFFDLAQIKTRDIEPKWKNKVRLCCDGFSSWLSLMLMVVFRVQTWTFRINLRPDNWKWSRRVTLETNCGGVVIWKEHPSLVWASVSQRLVLRLRSACSLCVLAVQGFHNSHSSGLTHLWSGLASEFVLLSWQRVKAWKFPANMFV